MTTANWMWIGSKTLLDNSPNTNATQTQLNGAVGWTAEGSAQMAPVTVTGPNTTTWMTTYQNNTSTFTYTRPETGRSATQQVRTFAAATFDLYLPNGKGGVDTVRKSGVLMQTNNGDVFFRPSSASISDWDSIKSLQGVKIVSVSPQPNSTGMATVGFKPAIFDTPIVCFVRGTKIATSDGDIAVEDLSAGDMVMTKDRGPQPLLWIGSAKVGCDMLAAMPRLRPVRIAAGALGANSPSEDLLVSPQHRILVRSRIAQRLFATQEVLVAAKQLVAIDGIAVAEDAAEVEYFHLLLDRHSVITSNGAETETLFTGPQALKSVTPAARTEILTLFPELADADYAPEAARPLPSGRLGRQLAARHARNGQALAS